MLVSILNKAKEKDKPNQNKNVIELLQQNDLFCSIDDGCAYIEFKNNNHDEIWSLDSAQAGRIIKEFYYEKTDSVPDDAYVKKIVAVLKIKANKNHKQKVFYRVGKLGDKIYIDIADQNHSYVEIDSGGWQVVQKVPVKFSKSTAMQPLALPEKCGSISELKKFLNLEAESDFILILTYLIGCLFPSKEYPILILQGSQGSAKSTTSEVVKHLIDLAHPKLRSLPKNEKDIYIAAKNSHLLCFDNLSGINSYMSDTLCRIATGCANTSRELYTNSDEITIDLSRPILINGIDDLTTRPDLADRAVVLNLPKISDERRKMSSNFWNDFEEYKPKFMGLLFDAVSRALADRPNLKLTSLSRMADFCLTACAGLQAFGYSAEETNAAILNNRREVALETVELNCVARAVKYFIQDKIYWSGSASELHQVLNSSSEAITSGYLWPKAPHALSKELHRVATSLRAEGIDVDFERKSHKRLIVIKYSKEASQVSCRHTQNDANDGMTAL